MRYLRRLRYYQKIIKKTNNKIDLAFEDLRVKKAQKMMSRYFVGRMIK